MTLLEMLAVNMAEWPKVNGVDVYSIGQAVDGTLHYDDVYGELIGRSEESYPQLDKGKFFCGTVNKKQWENIQTWDGGGLPHIGARVKIKDNNWILEVLEGQEGKELTVVGHVMTGGEVGILYQYSYGENDPCNGYHCLVVECLEPYNKTKQMTLDYLKRLNAELSSNQSCTSCTEELLAELYVKGYLKLPDK